MDINLYTTDCQVITTEEGEKLRKAFNQMHREKEGLYQFSVTDVSQIDLNRIVREQYEMGHLVTLLTDGKNLKGLLIHNELLAQFQKEDSVGISGEVLSLGWGYRYASVWYTNQSFFVEGWCSPKDGRQELTAARLAIKNEEIEKVKAQLAAARAFIRKITVKVHSL